MPSLLAATSRIVFGSDELNVLVFQSEIIDGFLNQVRVLVADVTKLCRRYSHEKDHPIRMAIPRRLQPCVVRMSIDLLFERIEDANPGIWNDRGAGKRHMSAHRHAAAESGLGIFMNALP